MNAVFVKDLSKTYKNGKKALDNFSVSIKENDIFSLLGENGSGKSTLINILTTYLMPDCGEIEILGKNIIDYPHEIRKIISCVSQNVSIDLHLSLYENLIFQSRLYGIEKNKAVRKIQKLIEIFSLEEFTEKRVATYSGGIKRRLDIAMGMISEPKILFLDEPTVALDTESRKSVWQIIKNIKNEYGTTVFMTTHYLEEAEKLSDTICIMKDGKNIAYGTSEDLKKYLKQNLIKVTLKEKENIKKFLKIISSENFIKNTETVKNTITMNVENSSENIFTVGNILSANNIKYNLLSVSEPTIEDVYLSLVGKGRR